MAQARSASSDFNQALGEAKKQASHLAGEASDAAQDIYEHARDRAVDLAESANEAARQTAGSLGRALRNTMGYHVPTSARRRRQYRRARQAYRAPDCAGPANICAPHLLR
jgi:F0F1-type ATP synthase membrane subunit b/b'